MNLYDKHDYSVRKILYSFDLSALAGRAEPVRVLDIGAGFALKFTGDLLYALALAGVSRVSLHAVDPALYGLGTGQAVGALKAAFGDTSFYLHDERFRRDLFAEQEGLFDFASAIQMTTTVGDSHLGSLLCGLKTILKPGALFCDISETEDRVTDRAAYPTLTIFGRSLERRLEIARDCGFVPVAEVETRAHAITKDDGQRMHGVLLQRT